MRKLAVLASMIVVLLLAFSTGALASSVILGWDPNTEPDLAGYKVYYKVEISGPPYDGTGAVEGPSPIDVGNVEEFTLTGLDKTKTYYFVVTAYDNESPSLESDYSNEVWTDWVTGAPFSAPGCFFKAVEP